MGGKKRRRRVLVAMSGGVDSSLAAALLLEEGYEVIGATMRLWHSQKDMLWADERGKGCCSLDAVEDARKVASHLEIPFYVFNLYEPFREKVVQYFIDEYERGRTPNPCIACNRYIKFDLFLKKAYSLEADFIATGHYARISFDTVRERFLLLKSADKHKDQTYTLYNLTQEQLAHTLFPLGDLQKTATRRRAAELGLKVAGKPDSQEICFIPDDDYHKFLREETKITIKPGPIYDTTGKLIGTHKGTPYYTIGQRKGLGLYLPEPVYVLEINAANNSLVVGKAKETASQGLWAEDLNFINCTLPTFPKEVAVKIRYNTPEIEGRLNSLQKGKLQVDFHSPVRAVTPGQSVVFYEEETVVGGGIIQKAVF